MSVRVRLALPGDEPEISAVVAAAFGDASVARFTDRLRESPSYEADFAFVAEEAGAVLGFTMLSRLTIEGSSERPLILTPMAVRPDRQREGIGSQIVRTAIAAADTSGEPLILVEGIPAYYPRFGFRSATGLGLERPDVRIPDEAWMALPLRAYDPMLRGRVVYPSFFPGPPRTSPPVLGAT